MVEYTNQRKFNKNSVERDKTLGKLKKYERIYPCVANLQGQG